MLIVEAVFWDQHVWKEIKVYWRYQYNCQDINICYLECEDLPGSEWKMLQVYEVKEISSFNDTS